MGFLITHSLELLRANKFQSKPVRGESCATTTTSDCRERCLRVLRKTRGATASTTLAPMPMPTPMLMSMIALDIGASARGNRQKVNRAKKTKN